LILVDTSVLIAAARPRERLHASAAAALKDAEGASLGVPVSILAEAMSLLGARAGIVQQRRFWDGFMASGIELVSIDADLLEAARDIDRRYEDAGYGFADCTLLAACERLRCSRVLSFDRRLAAYRPSFAPALELLP
jgi:predicted nucleic acid-binding protein